MRIRKTNSLKGNLSVLAKVYNVVVFISLTVFSISLLYPLFWAVCSSFKNIIDYTIDPIGLPKSIYFGNYKRIWSMLPVEVFKQGVGMVRYGILDMLYNTIVLAVSKPFLSTTWTFFAAYAIGRLKVAGGKFLYDLGIVLMIIPIIGTFPAMMSLYRQLNWYDNMFAQIAITSGSFYGMNFLMFYAALKQIPWGYSEAAMIDGASQWTIMIRIIFPMVFSTYAVFLFLGFLGAWNDYNTSLIWLPSYPTVAYGMYIFQFSASRNTATMPEILSGFVILMVPTMILYLLIQNVVIAKIQIGGLKG